MSSDLVRKVTVACGLLPSSMQYAQRETYEKFLHEAGCSKEDVKWPPKNYRDRGVTINGRVRKGLTKKGTKSQEDRHTENFLEINTTLSEDTTNHLKPIPRVARQRAAECRALITTGDTPVLPIRSNPRKRRLIHIRRMEMILDWGGKALKNENKIPEHPPLYFPSPPRFRRISDGRKIR